MDGLHVFPIPMLRSQQGSAERVRVRDRLWQAVRSGLRLRGQESHGQTLAANLPGEVKDGHCRYSGMFRVLLDFAQIKDHAVIRSLPWALRQSSVPVAALTKAAKGYALAYHQCRGRSQVCSPCKSRRQQVVPAPGTAPARPAGTSWSSQILLYAIFLIAVNS